jgi:nucleoside-diphosphate-sugar epimerase
VKVLFTGATGVIGQEAVPSLVAAGHEVTGVARSPEKARWLDAVGSRAIEVDLFDPPAVRDAVAGHDVVVHMATAIPPLARMTKRDAWELNDRLRREATAYLVDAAIHHQIPRMILQSIVFFYADGGESWISESAPIDPVWDALHSALDAENEVGRFARTGGEGVVLRFGRLYGPGGASGEMIESMATRRAPIVGTGENYVSSIHVADAGSAVTAALGVPPGTYNVADDEPVRSAEMYQTLARLLGVKPPRKIPALVASAALGPAAKLLTISHRVSNQRFREVSGWRPAHPSVIEGLQAMLV